MYGQTNAAVFHHLTVEDGLTDGNIRAITQDKNGFIWIGTQSGLNRYDGYTIKTYQKKFRDVNSLSDDLITDLQFTADNKLWIATASGLTIYDTEKDTFIRWHHKENDPQSILSDFVRGVVSDTYGNVWIATERRITRYSTITNRFIHFPALDEPPLSSLFDIALDNNNDLWITTRSGLFLIKQNSEKAIQVPIPIKHNGKKVSSNLFGIGFDPSGYIWCGNYSGLLFKVRVETHNVTIVDDLMNQGIDQNFCTGISSDAQGRLWFATRFSGLATCNSVTGAFTFYKPDPFVNVSVSSTTVQTVFCDRSGLVWAGTSGRGVDRFHPDRQYFTTLYPGVDMKSSLPSGWVRCFAENAQKQLLIGTAEGLTQYDRVSGSLLTFRNETGNPYSLSFNSIRSLRTDRHGNTWIGTASGLNVMDSDKRTIRRIMPITDDPYAPITTFFYSIIEDKNSGIWLAGNRGVELTNAEGKRFYNRRNDSLLKSFPPVLQFGARFRIVKATSGLATIMKDW